MNAESLAQRLPGGRKGQVLAVAMALVVLAVMWAGIVQPLIDLYDSRADRLVRDQLLQRRMEAIAASSTPAGAEAGPRAQPAVGLLSGATDPLAAAALQQIAQQVVAAAGTSPTAVETLPATAEGKWRRISLRLTLTAGWPALVQVLNGLTSAPVHILVDDIRLHSPTLQTQSTAAPIQASFVISAYRAGG